MNIKILKCSLFAAMSLLNFTVLSAAEPASKGSAVVNTNTRIETRDRIEVQLEQRLAMTPSQAKEFREIHARFRADSSKLVLDSTVTGADRLKGLAALKTKRDADIEAMLTPKQKAISKQVVCDIIANEATLALKKKLPLNEEQGAKMAEIIREQAQAIADLDKDPTMSAATRQNCINLINNNAKFKAALVVTEAVESNVKLQNTPTQPQKTATK